MRILGIETSCDETAVCFLEASGKLPEVTFAVLGNGLSSQIEKHVAYGGVYPSLAKREHAKNIVPLLAKALNQTSQNPQAIPDDKIQKIEKILEREPALAHELLQYAECHPKPDIDQIAVTKGPGLAPALWVGVTFANALHTLWDIPIVGINHMEGHVISSLMKKTDEHTYKIQNVEFPLIALLVSGAHTELVLENDWLKYTILGKTRDDAVGEAFDKVARMLGLPYPGGPQIGALAKEARDAGEKSAITLPRPMMKTDDFDFSFSGLKTAVLYTVKDLGELSPEKKRAIAREFEEAVGDVLSHKSIKALQETNAKTFVIGGGVSASRYLRARLSADVQKEFPEITIALPEIEVTGDNALMIAATAYVRQLQNPGAESGEAISAIARIPLDTL